ncbi:MAG: glycoside hydrolase family 88 protein [Parabacteroides sp.]|nr:glycoside hydrolase family 88 protein [Parabacteroides sp.]
MKLKSFCIAFAAIPFLSVSCENRNNQKEVTDLAMADSLLTNVLSLYHVEKYDLLSETYPINPETQVTYLAEGSEQKKGQEVSFLWPYSGMLSGCVSLYKTTGDAKYRDILEKQILPGLELYWDNIREPFCYQSYPMFNGKSDRFYDDNDWLAIDFCDYYALTKEPKYLEKAEALHAYIYSGWSEELGGGIFWCEQQRVSKNTCSNAPATVLCMKLYELTKKPEYLEWAKKTYAWTKENLCDTTDYVYWDNIALNGKIATQKYTYNSGQMIQAGVLLYKETGDESYLTDAQRTAKGSFDHFTSMRKLPNGKAIRFYTSSPWFNVIMFRGLKALYEVDGNALYVNTMADNARYAWKNTRDENGLLGDDWSGLKNKKHKWLLDNACMLELFSEMSGLPKTN